MWSDDVRKVVELFHEEWQFEDEHVSDPVEYAHVYEPELRAACPELEFLGLAVPDRESPFAWSPTPLLMTYIAKRKMLKKLKHPYEAEHLAHLLADCVFGYQQTGGSFFTNVLLEAVGLLDRDDRILWSEEMYVLFHDAYFDKCEKDGVSREMPIFRRNLSKYHKEV